MNAVAPPLRLNSPVTVIVTRKQAAVLALLAGGLTERQIAERLVISRSTTRYRMTNLYRHLGVHSAAAAVATAWRIGLLDWQREHWHVLYRCPTCG